MNCDPASLVNAARCFTSCVPRGAIPAVQSYLLCQIANVGVGGVNIVPPGSVYAGGPPTFTLNVKANTIYKITWGSNDLSVNMCGLITSSTGSGTSVMAFTGSCTTMVFTGTFAGTTVTAQVKEFPSGLPAPTGFTWTMNSAGTLATAQWNTPPSTVLTTEIWTSTDGINFSFAGSQAIGTSAGFTTPAVGTTFYAKIRWDYKNGGTSDFTPAQQVPDPVVVSWLSRIVTNGGALPAKATMGGTNAFVITMKATTVWAKYKAVNVIAPDNMIAARTPLIVGGGNDPWPQVPGSAGEHLDINGYQSDFGAQVSALNTGLKPSNFSTNANGGITFYAYNNTAASNGSGKREAGCTGATDPPRMILYTALSGVFPQAVAAGYIDEVANNATWQPGPGTDTLPGYYSVNRLAINNIQMYFANSITPHAAVASSAGNNAGTPPVNNFYFFGTNNNGTAVSSNKLGSFCALHDGLTLSESLTQYNAIQAMRTAFGGGFR